MQRTLSCLALLVSLGLAPRANAEEPFELRAGDRVVFVGNALIEREQRDGYWEAALTARYPGRAIIFRNLGWSGDTIFGDARAAFDTPVEGFRRLKEHVLALKPTVIVLGYGGNEAFDGKAGLPRFKEGLRRLLDALAPAKARLVFLAPPRQENLGPPLPDPTKHNEDLRLYGDVLRAAADEHKGWFVDLYELLGDEAKLPLTDDGLHLTAYGYWRAAAALEQGLGLRPVRWQVAVTADGSAKEATGAAKVEALDNALRFRITDLRLPALQAPADAPKGAQTTEGERVLHVRGLAAGDYLLKIDGKTASRATAAEETGFPIQHGPEADQAERLRKAIVAKNRLYFHRWRPQNETYLFGFRKQEQGQNAHEIPEFDPFVEKAEKEIAALARPEAHVYELVKGEK